MAQWDSPLCLFPSSTSSHTPQDQVTQVKTQGWSNNRHTAEGSQHRTRTRGEKETMQQWIGYAPWLMPKGWLLWEMRHETKFADFAVWNKIGWLCWLYVYIGTDGMLYDHDFFHGCFKFIGREKVHHKRLYNCQVRQVDSVELTL